MYHAWKTLLLFIVSVMEHSLAQLSTTVQPLTTLPSHEGEKLSKQVSSLSHSENGKRIVVGGEVSIVYDPKKLKDDLTKGCSQIRLRRFIGNEQRNCTTLKPVKFALCGGFCLPKFRINQLGTNFERIMKKTLYRYRCAPDTFHYKKIRIFCQDDGSIVDYRVKIIKTCKCKQFMAQQNMIQTPLQRRKREQLTAG